MKTRHTLAAYAFLALGMSLALPQKANAQFRWRPDRSRSQNLVERLAGLEQYSILVEAVTQAGLADDLAGIDRATIFAPTNEAFAKIPPESLSALLSNEAALVNLLSYHVVPEQSLFSFLLGNRELTTLNEETLIVSTKWFRSSWWFSRSIEVNESKVVEADLRASNGIIHGIDTVLNPDFEEPKTILELAAEDDNLSTLALLVKEAGFDRALDSEHLVLTVFAPTNEAFDKVPGELLEAVRADRELLRFVLKNHILRGSVGSSDFSTGRVRTVGRTELEVVVGEDGITVGPATVIDADLVASNGVVHVINEVLVPDILDTLVGVAESRDDLATFKVALDIAGLTPVFDRESRFWKWTIFAPNNTAFEAIPADARAALLDDKWALRRVLFRHVAFGNITSGDLSDGGVVRTLRGRLAVDISEEGVTFNGAPLVEADIEASNGTIHIVGEVIPETAPVPEVEESGE